MKAHIDHIVICFLVVLLSNNFFAQNENIRNAINAYQQQDFESALKYINLAEQHEQTVKNPSTLYYKGIILKELYNLNSSDVNSDYRTQSIDYYQRFLEKNEDEKLKASVMKSLDYLSKTIYNDAAKTLNKENYQTSRTLFNQYKTLCEKYELSSQLNSIELQYKLVLGQVYSELYEQHRENTKGNKFFEEVIETYQSILKVDSMNWSANYNLGIHYYNEAVDKIKVAEYDLDIVAVGLIQDESVALFQKALPYMQRAYELKPNRKEPIIGLSGIYYSLNDIEKSESFNEKVKQLEGK